MSRGDLSETSEPSGARRRRVLALLDDADGPVHVRELSRRVVKREQSVMRSEAFATDVERTAITLHHDVLPRLDDAGLIEYDPEANVVATRTDDVDVDWRDADSINEALSDLNDGAAEDDSIGVIEGRPAVIECGRRLADEATEELFCMYQRTDLLEEECLRHARDAVERGVEVYVGSRQRAVRDLTRRDLPEATIWEPQRGVLHAPVGYPTVGRLVLVDRRRVMLAVLDESDASGDHPEETALVGEGADNPLVVLVRELLGPRLDHLDHQSADFRSRLQP